MMDLHAYRCFDSCEEIAAEPYHPRQSQVDHRDGCPTGPFEVGNQVLISSHRKLLSSKAMVVNVAEKSERDFGRYD
jgi:hypothetical protein